MGKCGNRRTSTLNFLPLSHSHDVQDPLCCYAVCLGTFHGASAFQETIKKMTAVTPSLFDYNHQVLPGDVLLLRSRGFFALGNRLGQRALRAAKPLRTARFTHVALVISRTHIADATLEDGVRLRSWGEAVGGYDPSKCVVARHPDLLSLADDPARLLARVQYYYAQRYKLTALARRQVKHDKGVVCSQFVSLVLQDLGLPPFAAAAMSALPSDIDHGTRGKDGWRQFSFSTYGWHPSVSAPAPGDRYWTVLADSLPELADLNEDHGLVRERCRPEMADEPEEAPCTLSEAVLRLSERMGQRMASGMSAAEALSRHTAELDRRVLALAEALGKDQGQNEGLLDLGLEILGDLSDKKISGGSLLENWNLLYVEQADKSVKVLADADAPQRLARHRLLLGMNIEGLTQAVKNANDLTRTLTEEVTKVAVLLQQGVEEALEMIPLMHQQASSVLESMDWLEGESREAILARAEGYAPLARDTLKPLLPRLGQEVGRQALDQLNALLTLDEQSSIWKIESEPILLSLMSGLASPPARQPGADR